MSRVRVSLVMPVWNAGRFLAPALDSVLADLPRDGEVIAVDDGSTDGSSEILEDYGDRIRIETHTGRRGIGNARNVGARLARGDVLAFHDADDVVLPGRFARLLEVLDGDPEVDLAFGNGIKIDAAGRPIGAVVKPHRARPLGRCADLRAILAGTLVHTQATCVRRAAFEALGGFSPSLPAGEDWEFALRAALRLRVRFLDVPVFLYRRHGANTMPDDLRRAELGLEILERFLADHPDAERVAGRAACRAAIAKRLARVARWRARGGRMADALEALDRAIGLAPFALRYRAARARLRWTPSTAPT